MAPLTPLRIRSPHRPCVALSALLLALLAGCLQIDTHVQLNEDGSATITEKVRFSRRLLDLGDSQQGQPKLSDLLKKDAVLERMKHMGKGITLKSHKVAPAARGSLESTAVFHIPDLNNLRYVSPYPSYADYAKHNVVRFRCVPLYKSHGYVGNAGQMEVTILPAKGGKKTGKPDPARQPPPSKNQVYRELAPVFRDMVRGLKLRLVFESYAPIARTGFGHRNARAGAKRVDIINVTDEDLDSHGSKIFENEEVMLDLLRWQLGSRDIVAHTQNFAGNHTLPVYLPWGSPFQRWRGSNGIFFRPSRQLFDRHFKGRKLDYARWRASPPEKHVPAKFDSIGYKPRR
jgi:hypothetical protein